MLTAWSAASRSRLCRSWRSAPRPIVSPSGEGACIRDANLGVPARATQEFALVDDADAERARLLELRAGLRPRDQRRGLPREAVGDVPAGALDQLLRLRARQGGRSEERRVGKECRS